MQRDLHWERETTRLAAKGVADPSDLIRQAETRIVEACGEYGTNVMEVRDDRDLRAEALEELADARNYVLWSLQKHQHEEFDKRATASLRLITMAYEWLKEE